MTPTWEHVDKAKQLCRDLVDINQRMMEAGLYKTANILREGALKEIGYETAEMQSRVMVDDKLKELANE